jgi:hypothetical protein
MSVLPLVSFIVLTTAVLAFSLLGLLAYDEVKFQRQHRAANDGLIEAAIGSPSARAPQRPAPLPRAA